jgi:hypothetical protein
MWTLDIACKKVLQHFIDERNKAPHCVVCDIVLYSYQNDILSYLYLLEVRDGKIDWNMRGKLIMFMDSNYPYRKDKSLHRHHVSYKKDIQVPMCCTCHGRVHNLKDDLKYNKWKPIDKKPKNFGMFKSNLYKPILGD